MCTATMIWLQCGCKFYFYLHDKRSTWCAENCLPNLTKMSKFLPSLAACVAPPSDIVPQLHTVSSFKNNANCIKILYLNADNSVSTPQSGIQVQVQVWATDRQKTPNFSVPFWAENPQNCYLSKFTVILALPPVIKFFKLLNSKLTQHQDNS